MIKFKPILKGKRVILKQTKPNLKTAKIIFETVEKNRKHLEPWFPWCKPTKKIEDSIKYLFDKEEKVKRKEMIEYGIYIDKKYAGNISIFKIDQKNKSGEIGYWLSTEFIRQGYMTKAVKVLEKECFTNIKLNRIQIQCDSKNLASIGVARKCGYKQEGVIRQNIKSHYSNKFCDTVLFSKLKTEFRK